MKNIIRTALFLTLVISGYSCFSGKKIAGTGDVVTPLSNIGALKEGSIVYGLPRSVITIFVEMERIVELPGPYSKYAGDLLGLEKVIQNENEYWTIENVSVKSNEELDPSEYYVIKSNSIFQSNILTMKKEGLILNLNPEIYTSSEGNEGIRRERNDQFRSFDLGSDEYFLMQRDTAYKRVNVDSTFIRIPYVIEKKKKLSTDQLAEKAAKRLMELRDGKHLILTGEATVFPQNEAAIVEINRLEKEYTELFAGKTFREKRTFTSQVIPSKEMIGKPVALFQFSELKGPSLDISAGATPVTIDFIPEQKTKDLTLLNKAQPDTDDAPAYDKLFYRVPEVVKVNISHNNEVLHNSRKLIYQFGEIINLPANYIIGK